MEPTYFERFIQFVKSSFREKFKAFMPGCVMGFIGSKSLLWSGVDITFLVYVVKFIGSVLMAFGSGLATAYAAYLVDRYKENQKKIPPKEKRKNKRAA